MSQAPLATTRQFNVPVPLRDGITLRADVFTPDEGGPYPVLVCQTPYGKDRDTYQSDAANLAGRGYVAVVVDIRGTYHSEGSFVTHYAAEAGPQMVTDGYDTIEWAAKLPKSTGQVGTWGHSYASWCIWHTAAGAPPSLQAIFASGMSAKVREMTFGLLETGRRMQWFFYMSADQRSRDKTPGGPHTRDEANFQWVHTDRFKWVWRVPLDAIPDDTFHSLTGQLKRYFREAHHETWNFDQIHQNVIGPTYQVTGWYDRLIGTINNFTGMVANGPAHLKGKHHLIIGPWGHASDNFTQHQGPIPMDFGPEANDTYADQIARWYDYQYKGVQNGFASNPPVQLFIMGENKWRFENEWPLARTQYTDYYFHSGGKANTAFGDGRLSTTPPGEEPLDRYAYDPNDPVMSLMGLDSQAAPLDQKPLAGREDILVFQTPPLTEPVEVTGPVEVRLYAGSDCPDTDFAAKLIDVHPDGRAVNLTYGIVRARYRESWDAPKPMQPGEVYEFRIQLNPTGILFGKGHRIRLDIASSDFPNFDRNHNTGKDYWNDTELRVATNSVFHDKAHPSRVILPVIPR